MRYGWHLRYRQCLTMLGRERTSSAVKHALGRLPSSAWRLRTEELWEGIGNGELEGEAGRVGVMGQNVCLPGTDSSSKKI